MVSQPSVCVTGGAHSVAPGQRPDSQAVGCHFLRKERATSGTPPGQSEEGSEREVVRESGHLEWTLEVIEKPLELTPGFPVLLGLLPLRDSGGH